jgi:diguanylate cyclase (GGDEF)-like protein
MKGLSLPITAAGAQHVASGDDFVRRGLVRSRRPVPDVQNLFDSRRAVRFALAMAEGHPGSGKLGACFLQRFDNRSCAGKKRQRLRLPNLLPRPRWMSNRTHPSRAVQRMKDHFWSVDAWPENGVMADGQPAMVSDSADALAAEVRRQHSLVCAKIDHSFALLMLVQWAAAIATALWISPRSWAGDISPLHPHVALAIFYGGVLTLVPIIMTRFAPGERVTRLTIAVMQMLMSSLLIHLTGGRIETHFHVFGSLAFLAFYFDWQVLVVASVTIAVDHFLRGMFLPFSIFGTDGVQRWRWLEHTGWVVFCDAFLIHACIRRFESLRVLTIRNMERDKLLYQARYDSLTGLPNRSFLSEKITEAIRISRTNQTGFACLTIDLDRFKEINDEMGRACGNILIRMVAARLKSRIGLEAFLARVGGDEFVALIPDSAMSPDARMHAQHPSHSEPASEALFEQIASSILNSVMVPFEIDGRQIILGASIGISRFPHDGDAESELLSCSDKAMYRVKHAGRNNYLVYSPDLFHESGQRDAAEAHLRRAIGAGEFQLHYQPIFHASGGIAGCEALLRWTDPVRGNISPSHFIPLAEETGLIVQLGSLVLHEACRQAREWQSRGLPSGRIAVNISSLELAREDFATHVIETLREHNTPPSLIELEVTESALVDDFALAERHLDELRRFGIKTSIDDFGTGYSSLGRLRQLTVDTLKIDRSFVEGVDTSESYKTVVEHIIGMAHTLGMKVVAEGVETETQHRVLRALGCDQIQGFLLGRPMKKEQMEELLLRQKVGFNAALSPDGAQARK